MSAKTSAQPGRRTPLSLSGAVTKTHPNKGGNNAANGGGNNANGHNSSNANKQDNNKQQQSKTEQQPQTNNNSDTKENPNKKQQQQADKKQQQQQQNENNKKSNEKNQNGVNSNKQQTSANENKQQQQNKDKQQQQQQQQQNGNDNKSNDKDKKEKTEKSEKLDKQQEKSEKETKVKDDKKVEQDKPDSKKEEKKPKEVKESNKEDNKKEAAAKIEEKIEKPQSQAKKDDKKSNEENKNKNVDEKPTEKVENMEVVEEQQSHSQQKSPPVTPKGNSKANKTSTPVSKTPTKASERTPQKSTPSNNNAKTTPVTKRVVTTAVDDDDDEDNDIEMEPLAIESSPIKSLQREEVAHINIAPSATSTPGKILSSKRNIAVPKTDVQLAMQTGISPERPRILSQISGRKSIRPISDYTPSKFQSNPQFRESYRRINTELDVTNTSMNVTVGSEVPNNFSFSFFGRGRKRERTPPQHSQSAIGELQTDMEISPPKRARLDMHGFFSAVSSPLSLLRNRFSKATLQSSTPVKLQEKLNSSEDEIEVQNVSGVSVHEELAKTEKDLSENNGKTNDDNDATIGEEAKETKLKEDIETPTAVQGESEGKEFTDVSLKSEKTCGMEQTCEQSDIKITETPLQSAVGDPMAKNKRCIVM